MHAILNRSDWTPGIPVDPSSWPPAVRSAELARGTLLRCGPGVRLAAWPETTHVRARAMRDGLDDPYIPILMAAAWVWGCTRKPGSPISCSTLGGRRQRLEPRPQLSVHEFHYVETDLAACGALVLPTPARTACDLVRLSDQLGTEKEVAVRLLVLRAGLTGVELEAVLLRSPGRHRRRALERIRRIFPV